MSQQQAQLFLVLVLSTFAGVGALVSVCWFIGTVRAWVEYLRQLRVEREKRDKLHRWPPPPPPPPPRLKLHESTAPLDSDRAISEQALNMELNLDTFFSGQGRNAIEGVPPITPRPKG